MSMGNVVGIALTTTSVQEFAGFDFCFFFFFFFFFWLKRCIPDWVFDNEKPCLGIN